MSSGSALGTSLSNPSSVNLWLKLAGVSEIAKRVIFQSFFWLVSSGSALGTSLSNPSSVNLWLKLVGVSEIAKRVIFQEL